VPVDLAAFLWLALIVLVSAFVQGMVGFAFGMIAMGFATLVLDARMASFLIAPLATVNIAIVLWSVRDRVRLAIVGPIMLGSLTGLPFGLVILLGGSAYVIRVLIALLLIYVGVTRLVRRTVTPRPLSLWWGTVAGLAKRRHRRRDEHGRSAAHRVCGAADMVSGDIQGDPVDDLLHRVVHEDDCPHLAGCAQQADAEAYGGARADHLRRLGGRDQPVQPHRRGALREDRGGRPLGAWRLASSVAQVVMPERMYRGKCFAGDAGTAESVH